jgi:phosphotransferase system HPr-like phosphotransfer protein
MKSAATLLNEELQKFEEESKKQDKKKKVAKKSTFKLEAGAKEQSPVLKEADSKEAKQEQKSIAKVVKDYPASMLPTNPYKVTSKK